MPSRRTLPQGMPSKSGIVLRIFSRDHMGITQFDFAISNSAGTSQVRIGIPAPRLPFKTMGFAFPSKTGKSAAIRLATSWDRTSLRDDMIAATYCFAIAASGVSSRDRVAPVVSGFAVSIGRGLCWSDVPVEVGGGLGRVITRSNNGGTLHPIVQLHITTRTRACHWRRITLPPDMLKLSSLNILHLVRLCDFRGSYHSYDARSRGMTQSTNCTPSLSARKIFISH